MSALVWPNYPMQVEVQASSVKAIDYDVMFANINDMLSIWWPYNDNSRAMQFLQVTLNGFKFKNSLAYCIHIKEKTLNKQYG